MKLEKVKNWIKLSGGETEGRTRNLEHFWQERDWCNRCGEESGTIYSNSVYASL